ncbi:MAG: hypothetical protein LBP81_03375 [Treponema sp.]|jgi:hypothetical protein|nr:hypothetical protein [Treponema sp.]
MGVTEGTQGVDALRSLYRPLDLLSNPFYFCMKLVSQKPAGAKYCKRCDKPGRLSKGCSRAMTAKFPQKARRLCWT